MFKITSQGGKKVNLSHGMMLLGHTRWQGCATGFTKMDEESLLGMLPNSKILFSVQTHGEKGNNH